MSIQLLDFLQYPIDVNWPGKRILALECIGQFSQQIVGTSIITPDTAGSITLTSLGPQANAGPGINLLGAAASVPGGLGSVPNPITKQMFSTYYAWDGGAFTQTIRIIGTLLQVSSVAFLNLDKLRTQFQATDPMYLRYQFKTNTPACPPTDPNGHMTVWAIKWTTPCASFGWLPGNGFAPLVFASPGALTTSQMLAFGENYPDPSDPSTTQANKVRHDEGPACPPSFNIDFSNQLPAAIDHIVFYQMRASTYKGKTDFPVVDGEAGWDVLEDPDLQSTPATVTLFGDSGGGSTLGSRSITWQVDWTNDLAVAASIAPTS